MGVSLPAERLELLTGVLPGCGAEGRNFRHAFLLLAQTHQYILLQLLLLVESWSRRLLLVPHQSCFQV